MPRRSERTDSGRASRVPAGRIERLMRLSVAAGGMAASAAAEGARRWWTGETASVTNALLNPKSAERLAKSLARMRGAAMKMGQLLSLEGGAVLPPQFADVLAVLQDSAHTMSTAQLHALLGREYGRGWRERFIDFDEEPIAAASIGQVHRVIAVDARELALKVQFPGIARSVASDVDNMASLLRVGRIVPEGFDIRPLVAAVKHQLLRETDYLEEAAGLNRFRAALADDPHVLVPAAHLDLTTKRILAMDFITGVPLGDYAASDAPQTRRDEIGIIVQRVVLRELFELGWMQSDPNLANFFYQPELRRLALLDFGSTVPVSAVLSDRYRRMMNAAIDRDQDRVAGLTIEFGWVEADERPDRIEGLADLIILACEPLRARGTYDFGASDLPQRVQAVSFDLAFNRGLLRPPPPELVFIHRKLAGSYLICARLRARVPSGRMAREFLG